MTGMHEVSQRERCGFTDWMDHGPWRSQSVRVALAVVVIGLGFWVAGLKTEPSQNKLDQTTATASATTNPAPDPRWHWNRPFPFYVRMGASYVAAYCIGWLFRRVVRLILVLGALGLALLGLGKLAGWDTTRTWEQLVQGSEWTRHEADAGKNYLKGLLPSASAAGVGMFMGFRRRNQTRVQVSTS